MKVVILAARRPKCLLRPPHSTATKRISSGLVKGETLLERQVRLVRAEGLTDIRIVLGQDKEKVEKFIKKKGLVLEISYNDKPKLWEKRAGLYSLKVGMQGIDDDVLVIPGDVYVNKEGLRKVLADGGSVVGAGGHGFQIFLVRKNLLPLVKKLPIHGKWPWPLHNIIMKNEGKMVKTGMYDFDG